LAYCALSTASGPGTATSLGDFRKKGLTSAQWTDAKPPIDGGAGCQLPGAVAGV
jgi:hypothetical protein